MPYSLSWETNILPILQSTEISDPFFVCNRMKGLLSPLLKEDAAHSRQADRVSACISYSPAVFCDHQIIFSFTEMRIQLGPIFVLKNPFLMASFQKPLCSYKKSGNFLTRLIFCIFLFLDLTHDNALYLIKIMYNF